MDYVESGTVQCYYIYIIWTILPFRWWNKVLCIFAALMAAISLAIVSATMYVLSTEDTIALQNIDKLTIALDVISLLTDLYITVSLCVIFRSTRVPSQP